MSVSDFLHDRLRFDMKSENTLSSEILLITVIESKCLLLEARRIPFKLMWN